MGDSTAMTIEFLRARLLSERSVSKSARQRAANLAKKVNELEDQVRVVIDQRQQAEKAANEVLSMLKSKGMSVDFSEEEEGKWSSENSEFNGKEDEASIDNEKRDQSEAGASSSPTGTLSWKSRSSSSDSLKNKVKEEQVKRLQRLNLISRAGSSSSSVLLGKSCRKIKNHMGFMKVEEDAKSSSDPADEFGGDEGMERAIERQDQLIDRFMAEENAQREWEQKFKGSGAQMEKTMESVQDDEMTSQPQAVEEEAHDPSPVDNFNDQEAGGPRYCEAIDDGQPPSDHVGERTDHHREAVAGPDESEELDFRGGNQPSPGLDDWRATKEAQPVTENSGQGGAEKVLGALEQARLALRQELQRSEPRRSEFSPFEIPFGASTLFRLPFEVRGDVAARDNLTTAAADIGGPSARPDSSFDRSR